MKRLLRLAALLLFCVLTFAARCHNLRDVFIDGRIYFVDADCYSRMTRARMVAEHPGTIVRHHNFENWPQGVTSHTTAPLDYLIVAGKKVLDAGFAIFDSAKTSVLHGQTLDLAGALVGPLLGVLGTVFLGAWAWTLRLRFWGMALLLYTVSPILVHGTVLGRPDHQALLIVLLMAAVGAELALAKSRSLHRDAKANEGLTQAPSDYPGRNAGSPVTEMESRDLGGPSRLSTSAGRRGPSTALHSARYDAMKGWGLIGGIAWGLSLWVSLYEPLVLLGVVVALWLAFDRGVLFAPERRAGWLAFAAILAVAFLLEGWRIDTPDAAMRGYFTRWKASIGELAHLDLRSPILYGWLGWTVFAAPVLLVVARKVERRALPLLVLLAVTLGLTVWQLRWGYFLAAIFVLALPVFMPALRRAWVARAVFVIALWPVAKDWDARLFPSESGQRDLAAKRAEAVALRSLVEAKVGSGPFLAPWWLSPPIAYWTGQPGVAGSSHESLPGIVDTARFYLSAGGEEAAAILRARRVRWVLADEPAREISTSAALLGVTPPAATLAEALAPRGSRRPGDKVPAEVSTGSLSTMPLENSFFKIWRVNEPPSP